MVRSFRKFLEAKENVVPTRVHMPMQLPEGVKTLHQAFQEAGKHLYLAGGAVRDHVLGLVPKDYDLATDAPPDEVMGILDTHGIDRTKGAVGNQFGVVVAVVDGEDYEIATFRQDLDVGRQTRVKYSTIQNDAERRDLTINALYYDLDTNEVVDYVGGLADLESGHVRTVGDPNQRFGEDTLRVLRFIRFYCRVNQGGLGGIDKETQAAIHQRVENGLKSDNGEPVAPERIRDEFLKGFKTALSPSGYIRLYDEFGLLSKYVFAGLNVSLERPNTKNPLLAIAHLLRKNDPEILARRLNELKYPNDEVQKILYLVNLLSVHRDELEPRLKDRPNFLYALRRGQQDMSDEELDTWAKWHGLDAQAVRQMRVFQLKNRSEVPGTEELQGPDLGRHIAKYNTDEMMRSMGFKEWLS